MRNAKTVRFVGKSPPPLPIGRYGTGSCYPLMALVDLVESKPVTKHSGTVKPNRLRNASFRCFSDGCQCLVVRWTTLLFGNSHDELLV